MKKILLPALALFMVVSCGREKETCSITQQQQEIEAVALILDRYIIANETKQMELIRRVWAPDTDIMVIGTDRDERIIGWDAIRQAVEEQFRQFEDTYIAMTEPIIKVNSSCNTAWFSAILNYNFVNQGKALSYEGLRFTGVMEKRQGQWYIVQSHISVPADGRISQVEGRDLKVKEITEPLE